VYPAAGIPQYGEKEKVCAVNRGDGGGYIAAQ